MSTVPSSSPLRPYPKIRAAGHVGASGVPEWTAAEKVHGAHFAVVCDTAGTHPAKRRETLTGDTLDGFFGVGRIWPALAVAAGRFAAEVRAARGGDPVVTLYGELAGGCYPHPDVPAVPGAEPVQTGVWYAPGLHWLLFDASVDTPGGRCWIGDRFLRDTAAAAGLMCVPALAQGTLTALQELPVTFPTRVPGLLGLPALEDNQAEGYVLKPAGEWSEASADGGDARPVAKVKQRAFAEDARYLGSRPFTVPPQGAAGVPAWLVAEAAALLTPARAAAAVSKLGLGMPVETMAEEIIQDVVEELAEALGGLDDTEENALVAVLRPGARALARFDAADRAVAGKAPGRPRR